MTMAEIERLLDEIAEGVVTGEVVEEEAPAPVAEETVASPHKTVTVEGWDLVVRLNQEDEPLIPDEVLAERLGFDRVYKLRELIGRHEKDKNINPVAVFPTVGKTTGGRPGKRYLLNESDALFVVTKSETPKANAVTKEVIRLFVSYRRGLLPGQQALSEVRMREIMVPLIEQALERQLSARIDPLARDVAGLSAMQVEMARKQSAAQDQISELARRQSETQSQIMALVASVRTIIDRRKPLVKAGGPEAILPGLSESLVRDLQNEKTDLTHLLDRHGWVIERAARELGITSYKLRRRMRHLGMQDSCNRRRMRPRGPDAVASPRVRKAADPGYLRVTNRIAMCEGAGRHSGEIVMLARGDRVEDLSTIQDGCRLVRKDGVQGWVPVDCVLPKGSFDRQERVRRAAHQQKGAETEFSVQAS